MPFHLEASMVRLKKETRFLVKADLTLINIESYQKLNIIYTLSSEVTVAEVRFKIGAFTCRTID